MPRMWQDTVLALTQAVFAVALIPTITHPEKKPTLTTSLLNTVTILVVVLVYVTLHLVASAIGAAIMCIEWGILAYQRYALDKRHAVRAAEPETADA